MKLEETRMKKVNMPSAEVNVIYILKLHSQLNSQFTLLKEISETCTSDLLLFVMSRYVSSAVTLPVRVHADLSFDSDVLPGAQSFEYAAFVREALKGECNC